MKNIVNTTITILLLTFIQNASNGQKLILEMKTFGQKYSDTFRHEGGFNLYLGYVINDRWDVGLELEGARASNNIRMLDANFSSINWGGVVANVLTVSNNSDWTNSSKEEVQKGYIRNMKSYRLQVNYYLTPNFRLSLGPTLQVNKALTESTDDVTYVGGLFSDLEFDEYSNIAITGGIEYLRPFNSWSYWTAGIDLQSDLYSSSAKIRNTEFMGDAISYTVGIGFWIGS